MTARRPYGRPDIAAMTSAERLDAGLMTVGQAARHEHLTAAVLYEGEADRVTGPVPDDPWASDDPEAGLAVWKAWQAAGHEAMGCDGWTQDSRDGRVICSCGEVVPAPEVSDA